MKQKKEKVETPKFYSLSRILAKNADYNVIFGERSNGKTYATLLYGIKEYLKTGKQMAYIRRWREDLSGKRAESLFSNHVANGVIQELTDGKFNEVFYISGSISLPSTGESFALTRGILTNAKQIPDAQKVLQPVDYVITWERIDRSLL